MSRQEAVERARVVRLFLLKHGVPEVSIEVQEGRPTTGGIDPWNACKPVGVLSHHIASRPTSAAPVPGLSLIKRGRSDLPGPLANGYGGMDLVYRIITMGYANHPGEGGPMMVRGPAGNYSIPRDTARPYLWGTEYEGGYSDEVWERKYTNKRTGRSMTYREFMGRANAGLVEALWRINGRGQRPAPSDDLSTYHGEHKTWAPGRKPDRLNYDTERGRKELRRWAARTEGDRTPTPKQDLPYVNLHNLTKAARGTGNKEPLPSVRRVQIALKRELDIDLKVNGLYAKATKDAYRKWQKKCGSAPEFCDGIPGMRDLTELATGRFRVSTR